MIVLENHNQDLNGQRLITLNFRLFGGCNLSSFGQNIDKVVDSPRIIHWVSCRGFLSPAPDYGFIFR